MRLTDRQREVVEMMRDGWELWVEHPRWANDYRPRYELRRGDEWKRLHGQTALGLLQRKIVVRVESFGAVNECSCWALNEEFADA